MSHQSHERVCRFRHRGRDEAACVGAVMEEGVVDLSATGIASLAAVLDAADPAGMVRAARVAAGSPLPLADVMLLPPVERQEVWAAGVNCLRSKTARMEESDFSATAYDRVYEAPGLRFFSSRWPGRWSGPVMQWASGPTRAGTCPSRNWRS